MPYYHSHCTVHGCNYGLQQQEINPVSFHRFPNAGEKIKIKNEFNIEVVVNRRRLSETVLGLNRESSNFMKVCNRHFVDQDFIPKTLVNRMRRRLKLTAVPSRNLPTMLPKVRDERVCEVERVINENYRKNVNKIDEQLLRLCPEDKESIKLENLNKAEDIEVDDRDYFNEDIKLEIVKEETEDVEGFIKEDKIS